MSVLLITVLAFALITLLILTRSLHTIGPAQVGLVNKRIARRRLDNDDPIAFHGEAGFQAVMLMPGLRFKLWPVFGVRKYPWVQVPAGEIGVVISQLGRSLPIGAKSAAYRPEFGNFSDLAAFVAGGGQKGVQRPVLTPGTLLPIHPVAFLVLTAHAVYGEPVGAELLTAAAQKGGLTASHFGLNPEQLRVVVIAPQGDADVI